MITIQYAVKDIANDEYFSAGGSAYWYANSSSGFSEDLNSAFLYGSKSPATAFINKFNKVRESPHSVSVNNMPIYRDLIVVEVEVLRQEIL